MALKREYTAAQALALVNRSEGMIVDNGVRRVGVGDEKSAHAIGRHLLGNAPGALGQGANPTEFRDRYIDAPGAVSSGWLGKGDMAILLCELLNSDIGQYALDQMDKGAPRVMVHYMNEGKLKSLHFGASMRQSDIEVTPAVEHITMEKLINTKTGLPVMVNGVQKQVPRKTIVPAFKTAKLTAQDIATVNACLIKHAGGLHLQTLYPSSMAVSSFAEYTLGGMNHAASFRGGNIFVQTTPVT